MQVLIVVLVLIVACLGIKLGPDLFKRLRAFRKPIFPGSPDDMNKIAENIRRARFQWRRDERPLGPLYTGTLDRGFGNRTEVICDPAARKITKEVHRGFRFWGISMSDDSYLELPELPFDMQPVIDGIESKLR